VSDVVLLDLSLLVEVVFHAGDDECPDLVVQLVVVETVQYCRPSIPVQVPEVRTRLTLCNGIGCPLEHFGDDVVGEKFADRDGHYARNQVVDSLGQFCRSQTGEVLRLRLRQVGE